MYSPSFTKEINRLYTIRWIEQTKYGKEHTSWQSKLHFKELVSSLGVKVPETYQIAEKIDQLKEPKQDRWVLKPVKGSANRGVFPVTRIDNKWYSHFNNKFMSWQDIKNMCAETDNVKPPYIIEEFAGEELPDNWELYCFKGEIGLIRQRRQVKGRNFDGRTHKFWDTEWNDMGELDKRVYDHDLPLPLHPKELIETAIKISLAIPYVFARIDLFDTESGIYFGEVTHHPGPGNHFEQELDTKLGRMWLEAEARC